MDCAADCYDGRVYFAFATALALLPSQANDRCVAAGYDGLVRSIPLGALVCRGLASSAGFQYTRVGYNDLSSEGNHMVDGILRDQLAVRGPILPSFGW